MIIFVLHLYYQTQSRLVWSNVWRTDTIASLLYGQSREDKKSSSRKYYCRLTPFWLYINVISQKRSLREQYLLYPAGALSGNKKYDKLVLRKLRSVGFFIIELMEDQKRQNMMPFRSHYTTLSGFLPALEHKSNRVFTLQPEFLQVIFM